MDRSCPLSWSGSIGTIIPTNNFILIPEANFSKVLFSIPKIHTIVEGDLGEPLLAAVPRQEASILTCSLTCDSLYLALALSDSRVQVYEVRRHRSVTQHTAPLQHWTLDHPNGVVRACCASPREPGCVLSVAGQYVCKWQRVAVEDGWAKRCYNSFTTQYHLTCCAVSPDGLLVAAGTTLRAVLLWSIETGAVVGSFKGEPRARSFIWRRRWSHFVCVRRVTFVLAPAAR